MAYPTGELSVDLRAIADNWRFIKKQLRPDVSCGAVVKANAYGLGVDRIAPKIYQAGCRDFFVSNIKEAMQLKALIGLDAKVFVLTGCNAGAESDFVSRDFIPVIVSLDMLRRWAAVAQGNPAVSAVLKVNTGMGRLGLEMAEFEQLLHEPEIFTQARITCVMSHFACADEMGHALNEKQITRFNAIKQALSAKGIQVEASLANSAGVFLGDKAHHDVVRPGIALYGGNPGLVDNPMQSVVGLRLPILQVRKLPAGECVGYGATKCFDDERYIAAVSGGYADGMMRSLSNSGWGFLQGLRVPIVGRVSMDSTLFDVTDVVKNVGLNVGTSIEILGKNVSVNDLADAASTISYEILTSFGSRYQRCYLD